MNKFDHISDLRKGMEIVIAHDVERSVIKFGGSDKKRDLGGSTQIINLVRPESNSVRIYCKEQRRWHFSLEDLRKIMPPEPPEPPATFDPKQLDLD